MTVQVTIYGSSRGSTDSVLVAPSMPVQQSLRIAIHVTTSMTVQEAL